MAIVAAKAMPCNSCSRRLSWARMAVQSESQHDGAQRGRGHQSELAGELQVIVVRVRVKPVTTTALVYIG